MALGTAGKSDSGRQVRQWQAAGDIARRSADQRPGRTGAGAVPAVARVEDANGGCIYVSNARFGSDCCPFPTLRALRLSILAAQCGVPSTPSLRTGMDVVMARTTSSNEPSTQRVVSSRNHFQRWPCRSPLTEKDTGPSQP